MIVGRHLLQVNCILGLAETICCGQQFLAADPVLVVGDFFKTGDLEALAMLDDLHKHGGFQKGIRGTGIKPSRAATENLDLNQ